MKKALIIYLLIFVGLWAAIGQVASPPEWLRTPQRFGEEYVGSGYTYDIGMSPEGVISENIAIVLAEQNLVNRFIENVYESLKETLLLLCQSEEVDDSLCDSFYVETIIDFVRDLGFYNFEILDHYVESVFYNDNDFPEVVQGGYSSWVYGRISLEYTFSLLQKAAEIKYEYAYGKPVPEYTKETINKILEAWLKK